MTSSDFKRLKQIREDNRKWIVGYQPSKSGILILFLLQGAIGFSPLEPFWFKCLLGWLCCLLICSIYLKDILKERSKQK